MYSVVEDRRRKFLLALRTSVPIILLTVLLVIVTFEEDRTFLYDLFILLLGLLASVYFVFFMVFENGQEKILDDITQTFNRKHFEKFLYRYLKPENGYLALISIDNIKEINDRYGIANGDKVLKKFALLLDHFFSKRFGSVPIARIKAGDFLVGIHGQEEEVEKALKEFLENYDNSFIDNMEIKIFGSYEYIDHKSFQSLLDRLYEEIYYCKGKCKALSKNDNVVKKRKVKGDDFERFIADMIAQRNLLLLYQPTLNLHTNRFDLAEIIVKLTDDEGNIIHPSQYIPVINRLGLENEFDLALCEILIDEIKKYGLLEDIYYSFNISPYSVRNRRFSQRFFTLFKDAGIDPGKMVIELYESGIYKDVDFYERILSIYKKEGFLLAFDNFGACNASIEYIKRIDVDFVHFDKFFTKKIDDKRYGVLLHAWVSAFKKLGIKSVIKFIDDINMVEKFRRIGVDYVQGFAIAKPMSAEEFGKFLRSMS
ncbi:MAG: hypothetical protein C6H99_00600 [Epsilonproteobacteria bacterium]|nr:hypothetical protein [Campylobacterota bacterium]NPA64431.1 GGDEF domain-containing protein [Campylobacterota bacterium]